MMTDKQLVCFDCPEKLLEDFDKTIKGRYAHRTDVLLSLMREHVKKSKEI